MVERAIHLRVCVGVALVLLASCSQTHEQGSTETGNPPVIDRKRIAMVMQDGEVHVVGEPGAIDPPRGEVEVTVERTGDVATGAVEDDGSFDVEVDARLGDAFSVRVIANAMFSERVQFTSEPGGAGDPRDASVVDAGSVDGGGEDVATACESCLSQELTWRAWDPTQGEPPVPSPPELWLTLSGCNTLTKRSPTLKCTHAVPRCDRMLLGSVETIEDLLVRPEVQAAFDAGGTQGEPETKGTLVYELTSDSRTVVYRSCHVDGDAEVECTVDSPLEPLALALNEIARANDCELAPDCDSPWDPGPGEENSSYYWHDPSTRGCFERRGNPAGGSNGNRYTSPQDCFDACPQPETQVDCSADRVHTEGGCWQCGLGGGCLYMQDYCALECEQDADCAGEQPASTGAEWACVEGECLAGFAGPCL